MKINSCTIINVVNYQIDFGQINIIMYPQYDMHCGGQKLFIPVWMQSIYECGFGWLMIKLIIHD